MNSVIHVDVSLLRFVADTALPFLAALVSRRFSDERVKSGIMMAFAFVMAIVQDLLMLNGDFTLGTFLSNFITALVIGFVTHQFVWKPIGITGDRGVILRMVPGGLGRVDPAHLSAHAERIGPARRVA